MRATSVVEGGVLSSKWLAMGMLLDAAAEKPTAVADVALALIEAGKRKVVVVLHVIGGDDTQLEALFSLLRTRFAGHVEDGMLHVLHAHRRLYPPGPPARRDNVDYALLLTYAAPLAEFYVQVEPGCSIRPDFLAELSSYVERLGSSAWHAIALSRLGLERKLIRTRL